MCTSRPISATPPLPPDESSISTTRCLRSLTPAATVRSLMTHDPATATATIGMHACVQAHRDTDWPVHDGARPEGLAGRRWEEAEASLDRRLHVAAAASVEAPHLAMISHVGSQAPGAAAGAPDESRSGEEEKWSALCSVEVRLPPKRPCIDPSSMCMWGACAWACAYASTVAILQIRGNPLPNSSHHYRDLCVWPHRLAGRRACAARVESGTTWRDGAAGSAAAGTMDAAQGSSSRHWLQGFTFTFTAQGSASRHWLRAGPRC